MKVFQLLILVLVMAASAHAQADCTFYLSSGGVDSANCTDLANPCATFEHTLAQIPAGGSMCTINITALDTIKLTAPVYINKTVAITSPKTAFIDGQGKAFGFIIINSDTTAVNEIFLSNLEFTNFNAVNDTSGLWDCGSATFLSGNVVFNAASVNYNQNQGKDGGAFCQKGNASSFFVGASFSKNVAVGHGGALYVSGTYSNVTDASIGGSVSLAKTVLTTNTAYGLFGGGLYVYQAGYDVGFCTITLNSATGMGGGFAAIESQSNSIMTETLIQKNHADLIGGGFYEAGPVQGTQLQGNTIVNNDATTAGGVFTQGSVLGVWTGNVIMANSATGDAGGIRMLSSSTSFFNTTVQFNTAKTSAGISCSKSGGSWAYSLIEGNSNTEQDTGLEDVTCDSGCAFCTQCLTSDISACAADTAVAIEGDGSTFCLGYEGSNCPCNQHTSPCPAGDAVCWTDGCHPSGWDPSNSGGSTDATTAGSAGTGDQPGPTGKTKGGNNSSTGGGISKNVLVFIGIFIFAAVSLFIVAGIFFYQRTAHKKEEKQPLFYDPNTEL